MKGKRKICNKFFCSLFSLMNIPPPLLSFTLIVQELAVVLDYVGPKLVPLQWIRGFPLRSTVLHLGLWPTLLELFTNASILSNYLCIYGIGGNIGKFNVAFSISHITPFYCFAVWAMESWFFLNLCTLLHLSLCWNDAEMIKTKII